jgi:hypothetical protein
MNLFYPRISLRQIGQMTAFGVAGALAAGVYGVAHDQITYSLGPEYFTRPPLSASATSTTRAIWAA